MRVRRVHSCLITECVWLMPNTTPVSPASPVDLSQTGAETICSIELLFVKIIHSEARQNQGIKRRIFRPNLMAGVIFAE
jgi:hypothetical protein